MKKSRVRQGLLLLLMVFFCAVIMLPLLVLYIFMQKYFVEGIVTTGIKG